MAEQYGTMEDGTVVHVVTIRSGGMCCEVLSLGACISQLHVPDASGTTADVVLGFDTLGGWSAPSNPCMNMCIGRVAGRTAAPGFTLGGVDYTLAGSDGGGGGIKPETNLHGGKQGFHKKNWTIESATESSVILTLNSPDGDEGFPGALQVRLTYSLRHGCELHLEYDASTTAPTPVSLTNHAYLNLSGASGGEPNILGHTLQLNSAAYNPDDGSGDGVPTGELRPTAGTTRDYRLPTPLSAVIEGQRADSPIWPHGEQFVVEGLAGRSANDVALLGRRCSAYLPVVGSPPLPPPLPCLLPSPPGCALRWCWYTRGVSGM
jgi:aldose 1-epimerase